MRNNKRIVLEPGTEAEFSIRGYTLSLPKFVLFTCFSVFTVGLAWLPLYWKSNWLIFLLFNRCDNLNAATYLLIKDCYKRYFHRKLFRKSINSDWIWVHLRSVIEQKNGLAQAQTQDSDECPIFRLPEDESRGLLCFTFHKCLYIISNDSSSAIRFPSLSSNVTPGKITSLDKLHSEGLSSLEVTKRMQVYGPNILDINPKSIPNILITEILHPFYCFQIFSVTVWFIDEYIYYSICIVVLSVFSIVWSLYMTWSQQKKLLKMTKINEMVTIVRDGVPQTCWQQDVVPGDVVVIPPSGCILHFDALLLSGSCIANESMLTGESVPVPKIPFVTLSPNTVYNQKQHAKYTLFSGTKILQSRTYSDDHCYAYVINTNFYTMQGELIRSILYPKPMSFRLFFDAILFVLVLFAVAMCGFIYTLVIMIERQVGIKEIILQPLDIITIAVPPALPAALNIGMVAAQRRLKNKHIYCISPQRIDVAGSIDTVCFDKTGTLTEDEMTFKSVVPVSDGNLLEEPITDPKTLPPEDKLMIGVSTCHSLTQIEGKLSGDPMDVKMFEASGWSYFESGGEDSLEYDTLAPSIVSSPVMPNGSKVDVALVRQFPFSSEMQRMGVIVRIQDNTHFDYFVKGSPEKVQSLCHNLPKNFQKCLDNFTLNGFRVLALAHGSLDAKLPWHKVQKLQQSDLEHNLTFLGFLIFYNELKPASSKTIAKLHAADLRCVMVTGDNIATAVAVARDCQLISKNASIKMLQTPEEVRNLSPKYSASHTNFALTGPAFEALKTFSEDSDTYEMLLMETIVFARMTPEQKSQLVEMLQKTGAYVCMCGDGANDCGALKNAHVGVSLSELEASAASPFTSKVADIACVDTLIREGRASLLNSFATFKFMGLYSMIQFTSVVLLYWFQSILGDTQFLYIDLLIITILMLTMGQTEPSKELTKHRPPVRLFTPIIFASLFVAIILQGVAQFSVILILTQASWYDPIEDPSDDPYDNVECQENTAILNVSAFLYIFCALSFSPGPPFRKHFFTNRWFLTTLIGLLVLELIVLLRPESWDWLEDFLQVRYLPKLYYKILIFVISFMCLTIMVFIEFHLFAGRKSIPLPNICCFGRRYHHPHKNAPKYQPSRTRGDSFAADLNKVSVHDNTPSFAIITSL